MFACPAVAGQVQTEALQAVGIYTYPDPKQAAAAAPLQGEEGRPGFLS